MLPFQEQTKEFLVIAQWQYIFHLIHLVMKGQEFVGSYQLMRECVTETTT